MLLPDIYKNVPAEWAPMDYRSERYRLVPLSPDGEEYFRVKLRCLGRYYKKIFSIYRVQNPYLLAKFNLKMHEYRERGHFEMLSLFHDTPFENAHAIAEYNLDWRLGLRYRYGPGVYFSVSPELANKHAHRTFSDVRCMIVTDVLVQNVQYENSGIFMPDAGFDTVLAHNNSTFVKYFDGEFYPRYFVEYVLH